MRQAEPSAVGRTHASSVMPVRQVERVARPATVHPVVDAVERQRAAVAARRASASAPESVPVVADAEESVAVVPLASLKPHAPTSPVDGGGGAVTESVTGMVAGEPVARRASPSRCRCRCRG